MYIVNASVMLDPDTACMSAAFTVEKTVDNGITALENFIVLTEKSFMGEVERDDGKIYKSMRVAINAAKKHIKHLYGIDNITIKHA